MNDPIHGLICLPGVAAGIALRNSFLGGLLPAALAIALFLSRGEAFRGLHGVSAHALHQAAGHLRMGVSRRNAQQVLPLHWDGLPFLGDDPRASEPPAGVTDHEPRPHLRHFGRLQKAQIGTRPNQSHGVSFGPLKAFATISGTRASPTCSRSSCTSWAMTSGATNRPPSFSSRTRDTPTCSSGHLSRRVYGLAQAIAISDSAPRP